MINNQIIKPSINVYYFNELNEGNFEYLLNGIEEEGIPYELKPSESNDSLKLSYDACIDSRLGVGLGISKSNIVLHYEKLDISSPLFIIEMKGRKELMRALGSNAARLVKRMPFKEIQISEV